MNRKKKTVANNIWATEQVWLNTRCLPHINATALPSERIRNDCQRIIVDCRHKKTTFSALLTRSLGRSPPTCETQTQLPETDRPSFVAVQNDSQIHPAVSYEMRPRQTDRCIHAQPANFISSHCHGVERRKVCHLTFWSFPRTKILCSTVLLSLMRCDKNVAGSKQGILAAERTLKVYTGLPN